jgi:hypothetical protein
MVKRLHGTFTHCDFHIGNIETAHDVIVSRVQFVIEKEGQEYRGSVSIRHQARGDVDGYLGVVALDYPPEAPQIEIREFRDLVEKYYRYLVGPNGSAVRLGPGGADVRRNTSIAARVPFTVIAG